MTKMIAKADGRGSLSRPNFASGQLLEDDDLNAGVAYTRNVVRLLLRSVFGAGIVCGLKVEANRLEGTSINVIVSPGVAFDCAGHVIEVEAPKTLALGGCDTTFTHPLWVTLYYDECPSRPREVSCDSGCDKSAQTVSTRLHEGFRIEIVEAEKSPEGACRSAEVPAAGAAGGAVVPPGDPFSCGCETHDCGVVLAHIEVPASTDQPLKVNDKVKPRRLVRPKPYGAA